MEYELSMTLKVHIIIHHYQYYFTKSGQTMKMTNGEFVETCHSSLRQSEERHGLKVKRKIGTLMHMPKSWQSLTLYNSKQAGHVTPLRLNLILAEVPKILLHFVSVSWREIQMFLTYTIL